MASVYHPGELSVQERAGVREMAARIGRSIGSTIPSAARDFLRSQSIVVVGSVDANQRVWASLLTGSPGFLQAVNEDTVQIKARPRAGDPLSDNLAANCQVGLIAIEFATRRRMRLNGRAEVRADGAITIDAQQVYSNCPKYIQTHAWSRGAPETNRAAVVQRQNSLAEEQQRWIRDADTFFIASHHQESGTDASHRGGRPGFVRVLNARRLVWPDYAGNTMFQTLGNIAVNPRAGLLFIDFQQRRTLQITGKAKIVWDAQRAADFAGAERLVEFDLSEGIEIGGAHPLDWRPEAARENEEATS